MRRQFHSLDALVETQLAEFTSSRDLLIREALSQNIRTYAFSASNHVIFYLLEYINLRPFFFNPQWYLEMFNIV